MLGFLFSESTLHTGAHIGYFSGVSMLIPILSESWERNIGPWISSPSGFIIALGLILVSIILLGFVTGSFSGLVKSVGWMMLIPGILALVFAAFGQTSVYGWAGQHITGFTTAQPVVSWFVEHAVPKVAYLGGMYILIGVCCVWFGRKLEAFARFV